MVRKARPKAALISWRPCKKAAAYLRELGVIDGRNGKRRTACAVNMNKFLNEIFIRACEAEMHPAHFHASADELRRAWVKQEVAIRNRVILELQQEIVDITRSAPKTVSQKAEEAVSLFCPD